MTYFDIRNNGDKALIKYRTVRRSLERYLRRYPPGCGRRSDYLGEDGIMPYIDSLDIRSMPEPEKSILYVGRIYDANKIRLELSAYYEGDL